MDKNEGRVGTAVDQGEKGGKEGDSESERRDTVESLRVSFLNIGFVEGSVRAIRSKEFSVSSELSDCLCEWERRGKGQYRGDLIRSRMYVKRVEVGRSDEKVSEESHLPHPRAWQSCQPGEP